MVLDDQTSLFFFVLQPSSVKEMCIRDRGYTNFAHLLGGMVLTCNNMDYLPPVQFSMDIRGTSMEQWENLVQAIAVYSAYEVRCV